MLDIAALEAKLNLEEITDPKERAERIIDAALQGVGAVTNAQAIQLACEPYLQSAPVVCIPEISVDGDGRIWFIACKPEDREALKDWLEEDFVPGMCYPNYLKLLDIVHTILNKFDETEPTKNSFEWQDKVLFDKDRPECDDYYINETPGIILAGYTNKYIILQVWLNDEY